MVGIRLAYVGFLLTVASVASESRSDWAKVVFVLLTGGLIYEFGVWRLRRKLLQWPSDLANAQRVLDLVGRRETKAAILSVALGRIQDPLVEVLRDVAHPDLEHTIFHDCSLGASARAVRDRAQKLLVIINTEMFAPSHKTKFDWIELPLEWKAGGPKNPSYSRYRKAQEELEKCSRELIETIDALTHCLAGASQRV